MSVIFTERVPQVIDPPLRDINMGAPAFPSAAAIMWTAVAMIAGSALVVGCLVAAVKAIAGLWNR